MLRAAGLFLLAMGLFLLLGGCGGEDAPPQGRQGRELAVGLLLPRSGPGAAQAEAARRGVELAMATVGGRLRLGGAEYRIRLAEVDTGSTPEGAARGALTLAQLHVVGIVGPLADAEALAAGEVAQAAGVALIAPLSARQSVTLGRPFIFSAALPAVRHGLALARMAAQDLKAARAAVVAAQGDPAARETAESFREEFEALRGRGRVVVQQQADPQARDFGAALALALAGDAEALLLAVPPEAAGRAIAQARAMGFRKPILTDAAGLSATALGGAPGTPCGDACRDLYVSRQVPPAGNPRLRDFQQAHAARFGMPADEAAALTYDALLMLLAACKDAGPPANGSAGHRQAVRAALAGLRGHPAVTGDLDMGPEGQPRRAVYIYRMSDKGDLQAIRVYPAEAASPPAP